MPLQSRPVHDIIERTGLVNLDRSRRCFTRFQEQLIRQTFRFLELPAELRVMIYEMCFCFAGIDHYFDRYYLKLKRSTNPRNVPLLEFPMHTPSVLLLNRQIFNEAISALPKQSMHLSHGLLDLKSITHLITPTVLSQLGRITISVTGHPILRKNIKNISWEGHTGLLNELADILKAGHKLKKLVIDLRDKNIHTHTTECWNQDYRCDFRDNLKDSLLQLRQIRGIECVEITGVKPEVARELKIAMQKKRVGFLDLPGELRNSIYDMAADRSDISIKLQKALETWGDKTVAPSRPPISTPTVFLLNRQITKEASDIILSKPLNLVFPGTYEMNTQDCVPGIIDYITAPSIHQIEHLNISIGSWQFVYSVQQMIHALIQKHNLKTLHIAFHDKLRATFSNGSMRHYPDSAIHEPFALFTNIRGVGKVTFSGDLPDCYTQGLIEIMQSPASVTQAPTLKALRGDGLVVDAMIDN